MRSIRSVVFVCAVVVAGAASTASAQSISFPASAPVFAAAIQSGSSRRPHTREGVWFSGGFGVASLGCEDCDERETSAGIDLAVGGTLSPRFLVGAGISGWSKEEDGLTLTVATLEARVRFYPNEASGFFLTGGIGLGSIRAEIDGLGDDSESGAGLTLGLGWDVRVGRNVSITPYWTGTAVNAGDADANFGQLGVAVTIH
jgi:hypothetical protein